MLKLGNPLLFLLSLLGLPFQLPRRGNHTEKENVSLLPIHTCKQKANHATSLCILKQSNKPTATCLPGLPAQGWPACREDEGYVARDSGTAPLPNHPLGLLRPPQITREGRRRMRCLWLVPAGLGFPFLPPGRLVPLALPPAASRPGCSAAGSPSAKRGRGSRGQRRACGTSCRPGRGTPPSTPSSRPPGRARVLEGGVTPSCPQK